MARSSGNYGWSSLNNSLNSKLTGTTQNNNKGSFFSSRVISIVLDEFHPRFKELGEWNALGAIEFDPVDFPSYNSTSYPVAYPLFPNIKNYPLIQEVVLTLSAFSSNLIYFENSLNITPTGYKTYYINPISLWNNPHHNGYSFNISTSPPTQNKSYTQIEAGSPRVNENESVSINLGKTFKEKENIHPLLPFEGDLIYEGRWGNSIRLGSTVKNTPNNWSKFGEDGDPITIIRNGQGNQTNEGWVPIIENIENHVSSIYLTSTQQVPLKASSTSYVSYTSEPPTNPKEYAGAQILLDSGRLIFNAYSDHILLSSAKSININSQVSVNIDTKKTIFQSDKIFLGKENLATEPLMLGNVTVQVLKDLLSSVKELTTALQSLQSAPVPPNTPAIFPSLLVPTTKVLGVLSSLESQLGTSPENCTITSKRNFTL